MITKHLIGGCFSKSITTAYGVADLGNSSVFVAVVPLIQLFLEVYGLRGTMLLLGGLLLHLAVCGALMKPPAAGRSQDGYEAAVTDEEQETGEDKVAPSDRCGCSCYTTIYSFTRDTFQLGLFSSLSFWLVVFLVIVWRLTNTAWLIYYVQYATVYKEFTLEDASQFIVAYGIGRTVVCIVIGPLVQTVKMFSYCIWLAGALLINAIYYALDPWLMSYWTIVVNTFMLGNALGMSSILIDVVIKEVFGKDHMGYVMGWTGFSSGAAMILLLYFPGEFMVITNEAAFVFAPVIIQTKTSHTNPVISIGCADNRYSGQQSVGSKSPSRDTCVLNHCFNLRMGRKDVGPMCCVTHVQEPSALIEKRRCLGQCSWLWLLNAP